MRAKYAATPREARNDLGTIVFLLGREITSAEDVQFFTSVLNEPACVSLADCSKDSPAPAHGDEHRESGLEVTLAYPQLVALKSVENYLTKNPPASLTPEMRDSFFRAIDAGKASPVPIVAKKAQELDRKMGR